MRFSAVGPFKGQNSGLVIFFYQFTHILSDIKQLSKFDLPAICATAVCHATELVFVFHADLSVLNATMTPAELALSDAFVDYWSSFARNGDPNNARQPVVWPSYGFGGARNIIRFDTPISIQDEKPACELWDRIGY